MNRLSLEAFTEVPDGRGAFPTYRIPGWTEELGLVAGFVSAETGDADFGLDSATSTGGMLDRWGRLLHDLGRFDGVSLSRQVHGARVARHATRHQGLLIQQGYDGHITAVQGLLLAVTVADCVPVYVAHRGGSGWGILHAGWRGIASGMLEEGIAALRGLAACEPEDIIMHCGISVCGSCYEVGPEVVRAVLQRSAEGTEHLDLRMAIAERAAAAGVGRISATEWCTVHGGARFHSHRRGGEAAGRMAAFIGMPA